MLLGEWSNHIRLENARVKLLHSLMISAISASGRVSAFKGRFGALLTIS